MKEATFNQFRIRNRVVWKGVRSHLCECRVSCNVALADMWAAKWRMAFRGSISPRFLACNSRKVVSGPLPGPDARLFLFPLNFCPGVFFSSIFIIFFPLPVRACMHTISGRTLTAPTTSSSFGNYRIMSKLWPLKKRHACLTVGTLKYFMSMWIHLLIIFWYFNEPSRKPITTNPLFISHFGFDLLLSKSHSPPKVT